jgi:hypothetical protein
MRLSTALRQVHRDRRAAGVDFVALRPLVFIEELCDPIAIALAADLCILDAAGVFAHTHVGRRSPLLAREGQGR